jgi:hypothetical protein
MNIAPTFAHCVWLSAPRGGAAPAVRQSRFRGPCLLGNVLFCAADFGC